jgi:integrase
MYRKIHRKPERIRIGAFPELSIEQARRECQRLAGKIAEGVNPAEQKRAARRIPTFGEVYREFMDAPQRGREKRDRRPATVRTYTHIVTRAIPDWQSKRISDITRADVERMADAVAKERGRVTANLTITLVKAVLEFACEREHVTVNVARKVRRFSTQSRERFLTEQEIGRLWRQLDNAPSAVADLIRLALLTGARRSNLIAMKWADIDLDTAIWTINADEMKAAKAHRVPLSATALETLRRRLANRKTDGKWVFPGRFDKAMTFPQDEWMEVLRVAEITNFTFHDLRRSFATLQLSANVPLPVISQSLAHGSTKATSVYARVQPNATKNAIDAVASRVLAAATEGKK